ncbi:protein phosphatase 1 regulatory subunit 32-like [Plakobranchus ocellatus]|uniref:Protein phosphatase 1 regulatory subunit 32-like n=1 Tax=Plakobranchus ocellatus TaxID=259542 RepID=A0AAV3YRH2_9GAST|nr:protein phosphatase 1 regulatory subunit 32-like [Plakobranchus ocellatus]
MSMLPMGPRSLHIQKSQGADTNIMKFYITQNSTTYGARYDKFQPQQGRHRGTGYLSNFRPAVYYNRRLDDVDNPTMRRICDGNYRSVTQLDFQPYRDHTGLEGLPGSVHQVGSGFIRDKPLTIPTENKVNGVFIDTRAKSAPSNILPRHKPLLHHLHAKDPVELENHGYGPRFMRSETQERFKGQPWPSVDISTKELGPQEVSGFVHNINDEPVTYEPKMAYKNDRPAYDRLCDMPSLKADKTRRQDPVEYLNMQFPHNRTSVTGELFKGQQRPSPSEPDRLDRTAVGFKEETGYVENNIPFVQMSDNKMRFITHYMTRFGPDPTPVGVDRAGHLRGGVQRQKPDGFTKSTAVNNFGSTQTSSEVLRRIEPYVGRWVKYDIWNVTV